MCFVFSFNKVHSACEFVFDREDHMYELIEKYKSFKFIDEKGRAYPLHITKAIY